MNRNRFSDAEIPYKILHKFGLTQEMIGDLPTHALSQIAEGYRSPVLPTSLPMSKGISTEAVPAFPFIERKTTGWMCYSIHNCNKPVLINSAKRTETSCSATKRLLIQ